MRNYKKMTGRITALALSMMIVISAFSGVFSLMSSAAVSSGDITVYTDYSNIKKDKVVTTAGNVKAYFNKGDGNGDKEFFQGSPRLSNLNDNNFSSEFETNYSSVPFYDIAAGHEPGEKSFSAIGERYIDGSKRWMSLVLPLEGATTVEDILVVNHSTPELRTYYYEIFAAATEKDLFNRESLVYTYTNANKDQVQDFHVKDGALKGIQFVGMRVYNPCCEWTEAFVAQYGANQICPRILEFNVYGTVTKEVLSVASSDDGTIPQDIGNSVSDKIEAKFYKQGVETERYTTPAKLIDGKTDNANGADFMNDKNSCTFIDADGTYHNDGSYYMDFTYTVHPDSTVKKILVVNHGDKTLRTGAYELYAGDDAATLYNAENKIGSFKNTKGEQRQVFTVNDKAGLKKAYIGVRVTNPIFDRSLFTFDHTYSCVRFNELDIFGESSGSSENPDAKYTLTSDEKSTVPTGTKLSTFDPTVTYVNGETVKSMTGLKLSNADTGNDFYTGNECPMTYKENGTLKWYTEADGVYNEILYDFGKVNNVKDFLVFNHENRNIRLGSFKLYAAEKKEDLYKDTSLVANVKTDGFLRQVVSLKTAVKARFVALKTSDVCYNKSWESANVDTIYLRLSAFAVYGTEGQAEQKGIVKVLDSNAASCEVTTNPSVAAGVNYSYKAHGAETAVMGNMGTNSVDAAGQKRNVFEVLTDAKATGEAEACGFKFAADDADGKLSEVYTDGSAYFDIIYTLKSKTKLSDIVFVGHKDNIWKSSYELYASNSQETLFDDSNLLYTYNNTEKNRTQHYTLTGYTAKYVAVRITAATTSNNVADFSSSFNASVIYPRVYNFGVYGEAIDEGNNVTLTEATSMAVPSGTSVVRDTTKMFFDGTDYKSTQAGNSSYLVDGIIDDNNKHFMGAQDATQFAYKNDSGKTVYYTDRYMDIIHTLKGTCDISQVFVYSHPDRALVTAEYQLYASSDKDTLFNSENLVYDFSNDQRSRAQLYTFNTPIQAKYLAMRITKPCYPEGAGNDWVNVYPRLYEFNVYGTAGVLSNEIIDTDSTIPAGTNVLGGKYASVITYDDTANKQIVTGGPIDLLTNNNANDGGYYTGNQSINYFNYDSNTKKITFRNDGTVHTDFTFELLGTATIDRFYIAHHASTELRTAKYYIYAANDVTKLYSDENLVEEVQNTTGARAQLVSLGDALDNIRYVGVRVVDPCFDHDPAKLKLTDEFITANTHSFYPRFCEVAAFGSIVDDPITNEKIKNSSSASLPLGVSLNGLKNLSKPLKAKMRGEITEGLQQIPVSGWHENHLVDGDFTTETEINGIKFAEWNPATGKPVYQNNGEKYLKIWYDLRSQANVEYLIVGNHPARELVTGLYEVYLSNDLDSLYNEENLYVTVDNTVAYKAGGTNRVNAIHLKDDADPNSGKAQFVGIRVCNPVCENGVGSAIVTADKNNIYTRLFQFAVYGNYVDPDFDPTANADGTVDTATMDLTQIRAKHPNGLLETAKMTARIDGKKYGISTEKARGWKKLLQSCDGSSHDDHDEFKQGFVNDMIFQINKKYDLTQMNGFVFQGISSDSTPYYASHYQVYMAEEVEDLFLPENMAYEYNEAESQIMKGQYVVFPEGKQPTGNYIGFRIIDPVYTATEHTYLRVSMLYAWGEEAKITPSPANVAENMPIEAYFRNGSKLTEVSNENLTPQELANMTDSNADTYATINTKGSTRNQLELIYNLCNDVDVNGLKINTLINSTIGFKTMKVYAGTGLMQVNDESSLVWTYNVGSKTGTLTPSKTFQKSVKARYVRFVFAGTKDSVRINDIEVIAMDNQKMKTRLITNSLEASSITVTKYDSTKKKTELMIMNQDTLGYAVDNDRNTYVTLPGGIAGKDKYNLILQLGGFKTISNITLNLLNNFQEYWPTKMNVYVGDTAEAVEAADAKPLFTFTTKDVKGYSISRQIRPIMTRYFRVEMVDFAKNKYYKNADGTDMIVHTLADIVLTGTKVNGMNTSVDDERLITFSDKNTGMEVSIQRIDETDVFTDAQAIRVTSEKVTNWQMSSLRASQNKVVGKKIYKLEFIDMYGNVVKDLGGRSILVSFKKPAGSNTCGVGNASQRTKIEYRDSYELSGRVYATESSWSETTDNKFALLEMTTSDDVYWSQIGKLENFKEGNLDDTKTEEELEAEEIYKRSIHTTDGLFSLRFEQSKIPVGAKFTARNDTEYISVETCETLMAYNPDHNLVTRYNVSLVTKDGAPVDREDGELATITMNMPDDMYDNFSDFLVYQEDATGNLSECIDVAAIDRQLVFSMDNVDDMNFVVIGVGAGNGGTNGTNGNGNGGTPATGETATGAAAVLSLMIAAAFVGLRFGKRSKAK